MALVPSGRFRQMEKQSLLRNGSFSFAQQAQQQNAQPQPKPDPRVEIEQQEIGAGGQIAGQPPQSEPASGSVGTANPEQPVPDDAAAQPPQADQAGGDGQDPGAALEKAEAEKEHMRSVFFKIIAQHFGVNPEDELKNKALKNKEFAGGGASIQKDINKKLRMLFDVDIQNPLSPQPVMKGFFVVPNEIKGKRLDYKETVRAAAEFCKRYGLDARSVKEDDGGWRYEFITRSIQQNNDVQTGTSYDAVLGGDGQQKSASTLGEMIKDRRNELYNTMRKIAQGSK